MTASGGKANWEKIESCRKTVNVWQNLDFINLPNNQKSSIEGTSPSQHEIARMIPYFEVNKMVSPEGAITNVYQNDQGSGILTSGMHFKNASIGSFVTLSIAKNILLLKKKGLLNYQGEKEIFNEMCYVLNGPYAPESTDVVNFFFSKQTGLLIAIENANQKIPRITKYEDYRNINGLIIPFKIESFADDILFFREITQSIEFNPSIDKSIFYYKGKRIEKKYVKPTEATLIKSFEDGDLNKLIKTAFTDKRVLVDIWATWCAPCKIEFKKYDSSFYNLLSEMNVSMLYVSIDKEKDRKKWEMDINKFQLKGNHVLAQKLLLKSIHEVVYRNQDIIIPRYLVFDESGKMLSSDFIRPSDADFAIELKDLF